MRKVILIIAGIVLLFVLGIAAIIGVRQWEMKQMLDEAWAEWTAAGGATALADLAPTPIPDHENAAVVWRRAFAHLESLTEEERKSLRTGEANEQTTALVEQFREAIAIAHEAAQIEQCMWGAEVYHEPFDTTMPWLAHARQMNGLLITAARLDVEAGRMDEAVASLDAALALSEHIVADPLFINMFVHLVTDAAVLDAVHTHFAEHDLPADRSLVRRIAQRDYRGRIRQVLMSDALGMVQHFDRMEEINPGAFDDVPIGYRVLRPLFRDADLAIYLNTVRGTALALETQPHARTPAQEYALNAADSHMHLPEFAIGTRTMLPVIGTSLDTRQIGPVEVRQAMFLTAMQLRAYRAEHGAYPVLLDPPPIDPMTGKPMRYERDEDGQGFTLTSDWEPPKRFDGTGGERQQWRWR